MEQKWGNDTQNKNTNAKWVSLRDFRLNAAEDKTLSY